MNEVQKAERIILAALIMEYHRAKNKFIKIDQFKEFYNLRMSDELFTGGLQTFKEAGWIISKRKLFSAEVIKIDPDKYSQAHHRLLDFLGASSLAINWGNQEIISDGHRFDEFPARDGWKWFQIEPPDSNSVPDETIAGSLDSSTYVFPTPPASKTRLEINWNKWGVITAIVIGSLSLAIMKGWL